MLYTRCFKSALSDIAIVNRVFIIAHVCIETLVRKRVMILSETTVAVSQCEQAIEEPPYLFNSGSRKIDTERSRHYAVSQAISMMRSRFQHPLTLQDIASSAQLSPFHFNRIFRSITGVPPSVYLAALRIEQAKKLLLRTDLSVTSICFDVGYSSLGTFTTRFTQFVGTAPTQFRQISRDKKLSAFFQDWDHLTNCLSAFDHFHSRVIEGNITVTQPFDGLIFVGLFTHPIPQGAPISCTVLTKPGRYHLSLVPTGSYYLFAAAFQKTEGFREMLAAEEPLRCIRQHPISVQSECVSKRVDLILNRMHWTDAPILIALPWLFISRLAQYCREPLPL
jgi:AraC family transcriptional regulator